jgi:phage terminase large subunit-like protein
MSPFLSPAVWARNDGDVRLDLFDSGRPVFGGLDLSERTDLTALVLTVEDQDGVAHLLPRTWTPADSLIDRGLRDRAPYTVWRDQGFLVPVPGQTVDYGWVAEDLKIYLRNINLVKLSFDPWRITIFKKACENAGLSLPLVEMGQGYKSMSPALEKFEERALAGRLRHGNHPVLRWNMSNAVIMSDPANNRKLTKKKSYGRIDGAIASLMAVSALDVDQTPVFDIAAAIG